MKTKRFACSAIYHITAVGFLAALIFVPVEAWCANAPQNPTPPESEPTWHCPVKTGASIAQGNGGKASHTDKYNLYAWDYQVGVGTPIVAARSGVVTKVSTSSNIGGFDKRFFKDANSITVSHTDGTTSLYLHLSKNTTLVRVGEYVMQGELIGYSGETGYASGPHLHFSAFKGNSSHSISFSDFPTKGGIPDAGDTHMAPAPPVVTQEAITLCKKLARGAIRARELGCPDIGLAIALEVPNAKQIADYYYVKVLAVERSRFAEELKKQAAEWAKAAADDLESALKAKRIELVLKRLAKPIITELDLSIVLTAAKDRGLALSPDTAKIVARANVGELIAALRSDCFEDIKDAGGRYAGIAKHDETLKAQALADFRRLILGYKSSFLADLAHLSDESDRCLAKHKDLVLKDATGVATMTIELAKYWKTYFPNEAADAESMLTRAQADFEHVQSQAPAKAPAK
jgi:hypothetical protein